MHKRFLIHDLEDSRTEGFPEDMLVFPAVPPVKHCVGCFQCWTKTPGQCVIADRCQVTPAMLAASDEMILVSRLVYGGLSPDVKGVVDRSIGYIMPYFRIVGGEMHHTMRYDNPFTLSVRFYGEASDTEKALAQQLVAANAVNLGAGSYNVSFYESPQAAVEVYA